MLTAYGKTIRKHRIDRGMTLRELAIAIGVAPSFLSATETGRRDVPNEMLNKIAAALELDMEQRLELKEAAELSRREVKLRPNSSGDREIAAIFARRFPDLSDDAKAQIRDILEGRRR